MVSVNLTSIATCVFLAYITNSIYHMYMLFTPELCDESSPVSDCLQPFLISDDKDGAEVQLRVYTSTSQYALSQSTLIYSKKDLKINLEFSEKAKWRVAQSGPLTTYAKPAPEAFSLMGETAADKKKALATDQRVGLLKFTEIQPVSHLRSVIPLVGLSGSSVFKIKAIPHELFSLLEAEEISGKSVYYPMLFLNTLAYRTKDLVEIKKSRSKYELIVEYRPSGVGKLRLLVTATMSILQLQKLGFSEKDLDEVKGIFVDTNLVLLGVTMLVSALHLLFDVLSFKNDIAFWRGKKTMEGLSTKVLIWRAFSFTVVFLYLLDQQTSLLVLVPAGISCIIEYWKCTKVKISFTGCVPQISLGTQTEEEAATDAIDAQAMRYLTWILIPLCLAGAAYSLAFMPHKSWYSWSIESLSNGVYAFGFLFMLPQLFLNYKLKSVAHLPWRAFMYKAFNTFIDDLFAFIITMPTAHRVACFRDDIVFLIYLYQRWLYPIDYSRINEFGERGASSDMKEDESYNSRCLKKNEKLKKVE